MTHAIGDALAACADRLGPDATSVLERLAGAVGDAARDATRELAHLDDPARKHRRAEHAAIARAPLPAGLRLVHASWIEAALAELPARGRTAIASGGGDAVDVWLARHATATLPPMPITPRTDLEHIVVRDSADVVDWLATIGADQLAFALGAATAHPLLTRAAARITHPPRVNQLGPQRAAIGRCRGVSLADERIAVLVVAGRALAPHLANDPIGRLQLTRRLPYTDGKLVEAQLLAHAAAPLDQCPTWAALIAR